METLVDDFDLNNIFERRLQEEVDKVKKEFLNEGKLSVESFFESRNVFHLIREDILSWVTTEIGNRLRCGIYDNALVKKIFDEQFNKILKQQLTCEMKSEIKNQIKEEVTKLITEILKKD